MKRVLIVALAFGVSATPALGQAVPEVSQAMRVGAGYRRPLQIGVDPFRNVMVPRWGLVMSVGAMAENNTFSLRDVFAARYLDDNDELTFGDYIDLISLVPRGQGFLAAEEGEASAYLGLSFTRAVTVGFSAGVRSYGSVAADDRFVSFFRDGNVDNQNFSLGASRGLTLSTFDLGGHAAVRFGPIGTVDGVHVTTGFGLRLVRPIFFASVQSSIAGGGSFSVDSDSIRANLALEILASFPFDSTDGIATYLKDRAFGRVGSLNVMGDLLLRLDWPTSGISLEGMLVNLGSSLTVEQTGRGADTLLIQTTSLDSLREAVNVLDFDIRDSLDVDIALPRIWRVTASAWANSILQLDMSASGSLAGDIDVPLAVGVGSTWRFVRHLPLRAGVVLGGRGGVGYTGGIAIESKNFIFRLTGQSLGGLFRNATGAGGRFDFGFFF